MMKRLLLFALFVFCAGGLRAQGDYCSSLIALDGPCTDVSPFALFPAQFCEWIEDSNGNRTPIPGDKVKFRGVVLDQSGYHTHFGNSLSISLRPTLIVSPDNGFTNAAGCVLITVDLPGYAGTYWVFSQSVQNPSMIRRLNIGAHYVPLPLNQPLKALTQTAFMAPMQGNQDFAHTALSGAPTACPTGNCNYFVDGRHEHQFASTASEFWALSGGTVLSFFRCSLPEGGISDNDLGANFTISAGFWDSSVRSNEGHTTGNACDVLNPSWLANELLLKVKVKQLEAAMSDNHCSFGALKPGTVMEAATALFWEGQNNLHVVCGNELVPIVPRGQPF